MIMQASTYSSYICILMAQTSHCQCINANTVRTAGYDNQCPTVHLPNTYIFCSSTDSIRFALSAHKYHIYESSVSIFCVISLWLEWCISQSIFKCFVFEKKVSFCLLSKSVYGFIDVNLLQTGRKKRRQGKKRIQIPNRDDNGLAVSNAKPSQCFRCTWSYD